MINRFLNTIHCGEAALLLKSIPDDSVDLVITSPPYYMQRDYNGMGLGVGHESEIDNYIDALLDTFEEVMRIVKPTGNIVYNIGDKYLNSSLMLIPYRFALSVTDRYPVRLVNDITWVKRNPTPRQFSRRLVSSTEPFFHFVRGSEYYYDPDSFSDEEFSAHPLLTPSPSKKVGGKYRDLIEQSNLSAEQKCNAHDSLGMVIQEVLDGEIQSFRMKIKGIHAEAFGGQEGGRNSQLNNNGFTIIKISGKKMKKDVMESPVESIPGLKHTAVFPLSIIRRLVKLLSPKGGIVLDPYVGSGTVAIAAESENRRYVGIDIDSSYCAIARERIASCQKK